MLKFTFVIALMTGLASGVYSQESSIGSLPQGAQTTENFQDGSVTFAIDTPSLSYKPFAGKGITVSNSSTGFKLFMYAELQTDPAAQMKLSVDTSGVKVDTVEIKTGHPVTLNFTLTSSLKPITIQRIFPSRVDVHILTQFQGTFVPFTTDSVKFAATFPSYSSAEVQPETPGDISLGISPNPSSKLMVLKVSKSNSESVTLEIYDIAGNRKAIIANGEQVNGSRDFHFDASGFAAGSYFARLISGSQVITRKIIIH